MNNSREEYLRQLNNGWIEGEDYVFVSYASSNWQQVYPTVLELRKRGINVYIDVEFEQNQSENWLTNFQKQLFDDAFCQGIVAFLSINYLRSYACLIEQLANRTDLMRQKAGKLHPVFFITLEPEMNSTQNIKSYIYKSAVRKAGAKESVEMSTAECNLLQKFILQSGNENYSTADSVKSKVDSIKNKHDVATVMYELIFEKLSPAIKVFDSPESCAEVLTSNFTNDKNKDIELQPLEELIQRYAKVSAPAPKPVSEPTPAPEMVSTPAPKPSPKAVFPPKPAPAPVKKQENPAPAKEETPKTERKKPKTLTGDVTYTLYGRQFTENQSNMMLRFFAQVLKRHPDVIEDLPNQPGMNCVSPVDYSDPKNRGSDMPSYFRICSFFPFSEGSGLCVGTAYGSAEKLRKMALLLAICREDREVFHSEQVTLPDVDPARSREAGNSESVVYSVYGQEFTTNQTDMVGNIFSRVLERHPDKLDEAAQWLLLVALEDYSLLPRAERPAYFAVMNVYTLNGRTYSVGGGLKMQDKLKQVSKLLALCGEPLYAVTIQGYKLEEGKLTTGGRGNADAVSYSVYGEEFTTNQTDMVGNVFSRVLERHPDKLDEAAECLLLVALEDYSLLPRAERPAYFAVMNVYTLNGRTYSVGGGLSMQEKLKQISKLLTLCGEPLDSVAIQNYELQQARRPGRRRSGMEDFLD